MRKITDELIDGVENDLRIWGKWVQRESTICGKVHSVWPSKDETKNNKRKLRKIESFTIKQQYIDGKPIASQYSPSMMKIPFQTQKSKNTRSFQFGSFPETDDDIALEIDGHMANLKKYDKVARAVANHVYRWDSPREIVLNKLNISKEKYYRLIDFITIFVMARRLERFENENKLRVIDVGL